MRCETCHGTGWTGHGMGGDTCGECGGSGITHCCDGLTACNDPDEAARLHVEGGPLPRAEAEQLRDEFRAAHPEIVKAYAESTAEEPGVREMFEGKLLPVVDASRSGWWRFHEHYDRNGYCDNPARGY